MQIPAYGENRTNCHGAWRHLQMMKTTAVEGSIKQADRPPCIRVSKRGVSPSSLRFPFSNLEKGSGDEALCGNSPHLQQEDTNNKPDGILQVNSKSQFPTLLQKGRNLKFNSFFEAKFVDKLT
jgi:hypothetical protein